MRSRSSTGTVRWFRPTTTRDTRAASPWLRRRARRGPGRACRNRSACLPIGVFTGTPGGPQLFPGLRQHVEQCRVLGPELFVEAPPQPRGQRGAAAAGADRDHEIALADDRHQGERAVGGVVGASSPRPGGPRPPRTPRGRPRDRRWRWWRARRRRGRRARTRARTSVSRPGVGPGPHLVADLGRDDVRRRRPAASSGSILRAAMRPAPTTTQRRPRDEEVHRVAGDRGPASRRSSARGPAASPLRARRARRRRVAPLLVEGQDLQLDREVDLAQRHAVGHGHDRRREVEDRRDAGVDEAVGHLLGRAAGVAMMPIAIAALGAIVGRGRRSTRWRGRRRCWPTLLGIGVDQRHDPEAAGAEAPVVRERLAEVADADDGDRPVVGEAELAGDLVEQVLDVVPDAPGAVGAEVREVLADLGRVDAGQLGQALRGDRRRPPARRSRAAPGSRAAGGRRSPPGCGARRESEPSSSAGPRSRPTRPRPARVPTLCTFSQSVARVIRSTAWSSGLAFVAIVVSSAVRPGHARPLHRRPPAPAPRLDHRPRAVRAGLGRPGHRHRRPAGTTAPSGSSTCSGRCVNVPVARARHRVPAGPGADRPGGCCWGLVLFTGFAAGVLRRAPRWRRCTAPPSRSGKDVFGALPRVLAAVGSGVARDR